MIPQSFIQDLLARVDIIDVIERYLPLKKRGADYYARCPFHTEKSASFSVSHAKQFFHCFGCHESGNAIGFLMKYNGLSYIEAIQELARDAGLQIPDDGRSFKQQDGSHDRLIEIMTASAAFYREQLRHSPLATAYLRKRGLSDDVAARFGIGFAPDESTALQRIFADYRDKLLHTAGMVIDNDQGRRYDRFRNRIMFPIHDRRGRIIAFGGRIIETGEPKYLNSPETPLFEKGRELYGLSLAQKAIRQAGFALVVEGYMDVVALAQFGVENAVATLGTATTPHHIQTLLRQTDRIVFCFDGDEAGRKAAWRALENALAALRDDITLAFLFLPPEHDPDTFIREKGADALREAAAKAIPLASFLLGKLRQNNDLAQAEGRSRLVHEAGPLITRIPEAASVLRLQLVKAIADASKLTQAEIEQNFGLQPARRAKTHTDATGRTPGTKQHASVPRSAPSPLVAKLLRLVIQHPSLASKLPPDLIPDTTEEGRALIAIADLVELGETVGGLGALTERFRDTPHSDTLNKMATQLADLDEFRDPANIEQQFRDTLCNLQIALVDREIKELTERLTATALSPVEQSRLAELLREKNTLRNFTDSNVS